MFRRTKNFFKKSVETFKSYFSEGYEKLPKTQSDNTHHHTGFKPENTYSEFVDEWEATDLVITNSYEKNTMNWKHKKPSKIIGFQEVDKEKHEDKSQRERDKRRCLVTKRLKEMEILDTNDVDHVLDIQEVLHFYSRLTCPRYCEIVEKYLTEIYLEDFYLPRVDNSMPRKRAIRV